MGFYGRDHEEAKKNEGHEGFYCLFLDHRDHRERRDHRVLFCWFFVTERNKNWVDSGWANY